MEGDSQKKKKTLGPRHASFGPLEEEDFSASIVPSVFSPGDSFPSPIPVEPFVTMNEEQRAEFERKAELMVGTGQIGHILLTTFKGAYDEERRIEEELRIKEERKKELLELKIAREHEAALAAKLEAEQLAAAASPAKGSKGKKPEVIPVHVDEPVIHEAPEEIPEDEPEDNRFNSVGGVVLDGDIKEILKEKTAHIQHDFQQQVVDAKEVVQYLYEQRSQAKLEELQEEENLKRQGVILGQHIPSLPTKLFLDKTVIARNGSMGQDLSYAGDLVDQNRDNKLRRTGNKAISDAALERTLERSKKKANMVTVIPGYRSRTAAVETKEQRMKQRFAAMFKVQEMERLAAAQSATQGMVGKKVYQKPKIVMTAEGNDTMILF